MLRAPCLEEGCCECCKDTQMPLTREDIQRMAARGHDPNTFSVLGYDGFTFLANVEGRCFFLGSDGRCKEYADRPEGCRLYPLVLDEEMATFEVDELCPQASQIEPSEGHRKALLELLERLARQRAPINDG